MVAALGVALAALRIRRALDRPARTSWTPPGGRPVDADDGLPARVVGEGDVVVALLHGLLNSGRYWGGSYDGLARAGAVVVPDLLGFGRAPKPDEGYTADDHADAVAQLLERCDVRDPVLVGAHSIGGLVALRLAAKRPELVGGIVAFAPPLYATPDDARRQISSIDPLARLLVFNAPLGRRLCAAMCRHPKAAEVLVRLARPNLPAPLAADRVRHSWASYHETLSSLVLAAEAPAWLADIDVPVRIVAGRRDRAVDLAFLESLTALHEHVSLRIVEDGGHDLPLSHPQLCVDELDAALARARTIEES